MDEKFVALHAVRVAFCHGGIFDGGEMTSQTVRIRNATGMFREFDGKGIRPGCLADHVADAGVRLVSHAVSDIAPGKVALDAGKLFVPRCLPREIVVFHAVT